MSHDPLVAEGAMQPPVRQQRGFWNMGRVSVLMKLSDGWLQPFSRTNFLNGSVMVSWADGFSAPLGTWKLWLEAFTQSCHRRCQRVFPTLLGERPAQKHQSRFCSMDFFQVQMLGMQKNFNNIESIKKHQTTSKYTVLRKDGLWTRCPQLNESYPFGTFVPHGLHAFTFRWGGSPRIRWNAMWNPSWQLESTSRSFILVALCPLTVGRTKAFAFMIIYAPFQLRLN